MRDMTEPEMASFYDKGECPHCKQWKFVEGPSGGSSVNVKCDNCGLILNVSHFNIRFGQVLAEPLGYMVPTVPDEVVFNAPVIKWWMKIQSWLLKG